MAETQKTELGRQEPGFSWYQLLFKVPGRRLWNAAVLTPSSGSDCEAHLF